MLRLLSAMKEQCSFLKFNVNANKDNRKENRFPPVQSNRRYTQRYETYRRPASGTSFAHAGTHNRNYVNATTNNVQYVNGNNRVDVGKVGCYNCGEFNPLTPGKGEISLPHAGLFSASLKMKINIFFPFRNCKK